jgi:hypothetical protein
MLDGFPETLRRPLVPEVAPPQVRLVRFETDVVSPLAPAECQPELVDDRPRDFILYREDVLELAIEPLRPQRDIVGDADELGVDPQPRARPHDRSLDDEVDI